MRKNNKICFIFDRFYPSVGGAQNLMKSLAEGLIDKDYDISIITLKLKGTKSYEDLNHIKIYRVPYILGRSTFGFLVLYYSIFNKSYRNLISDCDVIHTSGIIGPKTAAIIAKLYKKPIVYTVYEVLGKDWYLVIKNKLLGLILYYFEKITFKFKFNKIVSISNYTKKSIQTCLPKDNNNVKRIYCGLGYKKQIVDQLDISLPSKFALYYGRPGKTKGIWVLINSLKKTEKHIFIVLILANEPSNQRRKIVNYVKNNNLNNRILILDPVSYSDLCFIRKKSLFVIVPSLTEGFGFSAAEASYDGKAVLCSDCGALPEVILNNETGIHFKSNDSDDLALKINFLFNDQSKCLELGENGQEYIKKFNITQMINEYHKIYNELT